MAIAFDAASSTSGAVNPVTISHTCTGSDLIILVGTCAHTTGTVSGITYDGVALSQVGSDNVSSRVVGELWYLIAPSTGANDVVVTSTGSWFRGAVGISSFTGVHQTTPLGTVATATGVSATPSVTVTSASGELVIDTVAHEGAGIPSVGSGQTSRWSEQLSTEDGLGNSGSTEAGASSVTMDWSITSEDWVSVGVSMKPSAASGTTPKGIFNNPFFGPFGGPI